MLNKTLRCNNQQIYTKFKKNICCKYYPSCSKPKDTNKYLTFVTDVVVFENNVSYLKQAQLCSIECGSIPVSYTHLDAADE